MHEVKFKPGDVIQQNSYLYGEPSDLGLFLTHSDMGDSHITNMMIPHGDLVTVISIQIVRVEGKDPTLWMTCLAGDGRIGHVAITSPWGWLSATIISRTEAI